MGTKVVVDGLDETVALATAPCKPFVQDKKETESTGSQPEPVCR